MKRFLAAWAVTVAFLLCAGQAHAAATQLPPGMQCFQATTGTNGMVGTLGAITGGTGGTTGTYAGVALTGGSGSGATANIIVAGGAVTSVTILNPGIQYVVGDTLSAASGTIGGTSGFSAPIASVAINSSLAGGTVAFYVPSTTTFKQTWKNAAQTVLNTNPVTLDQNGCAIIYGTGIYRQVLQDSLQNTVWDQVTTDVSASNSTFWAGVAGGTPNVVTVTAPGFNGTDGSILNFTALSTNTSAATLNPSSFGAIPVLKDTTAGPVALIGGEITQTNPISVIFRASDNAFHMLNPPIQSASGATSPLCGAIGLKITNDVTLPNTVINLTADQVVMQATSGIVINRSNVSFLAINITTGQIISAANGMDGEAPGTSAWLNIWAIDNGAAPAGLVSTSATAPTMPSGYTYRCRLGAMRVDGSSNLLRTRQNGSRASYTASPPTMFSGGSGGVATSLATGTFVPPTATSIEGTLSLSGANSGSILTNATTTLLSMSSSAATNLGIPFSVNLESTNIFYSITGTGTITAVGWKDKVNAN